MTKTSTGLVIERPVAGDVEALARLFHEDMEALGLETSLEGKRTLAEAVIADMGSAHPGCVCWVARVGAGQEAVGVILGNYYWSLKFGGRAVWIEALYVSPGYRRMGTGRLLVEALLDWAEAAGVPGVDIEAYRGNTPASVLYRTMGFDRLGRERFSMRLGE
jgi:GNAT superfamily N-acetyltransferase